MIEQLIYVSRAVRPLTTAGIEALLEVSRRNNQRLGVTGFLLFDGKSFMQLLEGDHETIETLFDVIRRDERHKDVQALIRQPAAERALSNWSMAYVLVYEDQIKSFGGTMNEEGARELSGMLMHSEDVTRRTVGQVLRELWVGP